MGQVLVTGAVPLGVDVGIAEAVVGAEVDDAQAVPQQRRQNAHAGAVRQTAEDALDAARQQSVGVERLAAKVDATGEAGVQVGDERGVVLARGHGGDLDLRMAQAGF